VEAEHGLQLRRGALSSIELEQTPNVVGVLAGEDLVLIRGQGIAPEQTILIIAILIVIEE
jgi:hypothetical protein